MLYFATGPEGRGLQVTFGLIAALLLFLTIYSIFNRKRNPAQAQKSVKAVSTILIVIGAIIIIGFLLLVLVFTFGHPFQGVAP